MQHQDYDKIFKENIGKVASSLVEKLCGISATHWENVSRAIPRTIERRTDWLKIGLTCAISNNPSLFKLIICRLIMT